jgi:hypothetical protein
VVRSDRSQVSPGGMRGQPARVFVVGADPMGMRMLGTVAWRHPVEFVPLLGLDEVRPAVGDPLGFDELVARARQRVADDGGPVDAVVGWWDFPTTGIVPVLRSGLGLPGASPRSVAALEHKYWSRIVQRSVVPGAVPRFDVLDPFAPLPDRLALPFPVWIKPIKSHSSHLGFRVSSADQLRQAVAVIRERIDRMGARFDEFLDHIDVPDEVRGVTGRHCIVEELIDTDRQCTLEGYIHEGRATIYGTVDSVRSASHPSCFSAYRYPSTIPAPVRERMADMAGAVVLAAGYDDAPFNIEFYWDEAADTLMLLEVNCRISKSHCPLFWMVDGASHQQVLVELALGKAPEPAFRRGRHRVAAKYMLRAFEDGMVRHLPDQRELDALERQSPDALFTPLVAPGERLSHLEYQDSYSYEIAELYLGADSHEELQRAAERACRLLHVAYLDRHLEPA